MTQEQVMALIDKSAMAIAKILQHEDLLPYWESILDETKGAMREFEAEREVKASYNKYDYYHPDGNMNV